MFTYELVSSKNAHETIITLSNREFQLFVKRVKKQWGTSRLFYLFEHNKVFFITGRKNQLVVNNFFLPDIYYIFDNLVYSYLYKRICNELLEKTWLKNTITEYVSRVDKTLLSDFNSNYQPKPFQSEFIDLYSDRVQQYQLDGLILAFEQGLGKTYTSLALMHLLKKEKVIIVAPNNTIREVWQNHVNDIFKINKQAWVIGDKVFDADYFIFNYEAMDKFHLIEQYVRDKDVGIIVDECHNFRNDETKRVKGVKAIKTATNCTDVLLMSGTPIKALGSEMLPAISLIDPKYYTEEIGLLFKKVFGSNKAQVLDILNHRLGRMMHRKMKKEVLTGLPEKYEETIYIKIPNGNHYTLNNVKKLIEDFSKERIDYYTKNKDTFLETYEMIMKIFESTGKYDPLELKKYKEGVKYFQRFKYTSQSLQHRELARNLNIFENNVIIPQLPSQYKEQFRNCKTVVKYLHLKVMGEIIGGLLSRLRINMISEMLKYAKIDQLIEDARKKTILFTDYVDVLKTAYDYLKHDKNLHPVTVYGENIKDILKTLGAFKTKPEINPLIASTKTLSTGVTLIEANVVIFLNKPWRHVDYLQGSDRVYRIGQDEDVYIYGIILDTGQEPNLSSRMEEIADWSKMMFDGIVGNEGSPTEEVVMETYGYLKDKNIEEILSCQMEEEIITEFLKPKEKGHIIKKCLFHQFF